MRGSETNSWQGNQKNWQNGDSTLNVQFRFLISRHQCVCVIGWLCTGSAYTLITSPDCWLNNRYSQGDCLAITKETLGGSLLGLWSCECRISATGATAVFLTARFVINRSCCKRVACIWCTHTVERRFQGNIDWRFSCMCVPKFALSVCLLVSQF